MTQTEETAGEAITRHLAEMEAWIAAAQTDYAHEQAAEALAASSVAQAHAAAVHAIVAGGSFTGATLPPWMPGRRTSTRAGS